MKLEPNYVLHTSSILHSVFLFVLSGPLQVINEMGTAFAFHFRFSKIHGFEGFGKVAVMKEAKLKAKNEIVHGLPVPR